LLPTGNDPRCDVTGESPCGRDRGSLHEGCTHRRCIWTHGDVRRCAFRRCAGRIALHAKANLSERQPRLPHPRRPCAFTASPVEVMGRYLNHSDQGECLRNLLEKVPSGPKPSKTRTPRRVCRRHQSAKVEELIQGHADGVPADDLAARFRVDQSTVQKHARRHDVRRRSPRPGESISRSCPAVTRREVSGQAGEAFRRLPLTLWPLPCTGRGSHCNLGGDGSTNRSSSPLFKPRLSSAWRSPLGPD